MKYIIIGTGNICRTYIDALKNLPGSEITGFISRSGKSPETAQALPAWKDLEQVDRTYDSVIITAPNSFHHRYARQAAALGKHILTEKPLDITTEAMDQMIQGAKQAGVTLSVSFQRRMNPDNLKLKKLIDSGALGKIFAVDLSCKFWRDQDYYDSAPYRGSVDIDGGGPFMQQAVHNLDLYQWLFGMPVRVKSMMGTFLHQMETEDHGAALMAHENGMIGSIIASTATRPGFKARMEVHSEKGYFITTDDKISDWEIDGVENPAEKVADFSEKVSNVPTISDSSRHQAVLLDFEAAVKDGREPLITGESAKNTTDLVLEIYRQASM